MKKLLFVISLLTSVSLYGQLMTADYYVGQGERMLTRKNYDSAIYYWKYVLENFPNKNQECSRATYRIAGAYEKDSIGKAITWYKKIIESEKVNDMDKGMEVLEPYANYRHNSCLRLAALFARRHDYEEASFWVNQSLYRYRYITYVGTAFEAKMVNVALAQADYFKAMNMMDSAIYILVHKILDTDIKYRLPEMDVTKNTDADLYTRPAAVVCKLIDQQYGKDAFKSQLLKAIKKLKVKKDKKHKWKIAEFKLYGIKYRIVSSDYTKTKNQFIAELKQSKLFVELDK